MYEDAFGDTAGFAISVLIISGMVMCILILALTRLGEYFVEYNERKYDEEILKKESENVRLSDAKKLAEPSKQQYDMKKTDVDFSISTKDAIVVTEVVYAD